MDLTDIERVLKITPLITNYGRPLVVEAQVTDEDGVVTQYRWKARMALGANVGVVLVDDWRVV